MYVGQLCRQLWSLTGGWWMGPGTQHRPAPATQHQHQIARYTQLFQHYTSTTNTPAPALHCYKTKLLMLKKQTHPNHPHQQQPAADALNCTTTGWLDRMGLGMSWNILVLLLKNREKSWILIQNYNFQKISSSWFKSSVKMIKYLLFWFIQPSLIISSSPPRYSSQLFR